MPRNLNPIVFIWHSSSASNAGLRPKCVCEMACASHHHGNARSLANYLLELAHRDTVNDMKPDPKNLRRSTEGAACIRSEGLRRAAAVAAGSCSWKGDQRETQCDILNQLCKRSSVSNSIDNYVPRDVGGKISVGHSCGEWSYLVVGGLGAMAKGPRLQLGSLNAV